MAARLPPVRTSTSTPASRTSAIRSPRRLSPGCGASEGSPSLLRSRAPQPTQLGASGRFLPSRGSLGSVCFLDRDPAAFRLHLAHRDADLEDSLLVSGGDIGRASCRER